MRYAYCLVPFIALMCACAGVKYEPDPEGRWFPPKGLRYYEPAWFIMGYVKGNGDVVTESMVLPDVTKRMSAHPYAILADSDSTMEFKDGVLASSVESGDATAVPVAVITAAKKVVSAYLDAQFGGAVDKRKVDGMKVHGPYLFKLVSSGAGVKLIGDSGQIIDIANPNRTAKPNPDSGETPPASNGGEGSTGASNS